MPRATERPERLVGSRLITQWCHHFRGPKGCERGDGCTFAHCEEDLRKTYNKEHTAKMHETRKMVFCRFFAQGSDCREDCDFAHGRAELGEPKRGFASSPIEWSGPLPKSGPIPESEWQTSPWPIPKSGPNEWRATLDGDNIWRWHPPLNIDDHEEPDSTRDQRDREFQECVRDQLQRREREEREQQREQEKPGANPWANFVAKQSPVSPPDLRIPRQPAGPPTQQPQDEQQHRIRGQPAGPPSQQPQDEQQQQRHQDAQPPQPKQPALGLRALHLPPDEWVMLHQRTAGRRHASTQTEDIAAAEAVRPPTPQQPPRPQALKKEAASSRRRSSSPYVMPPFPKSAPTLARGDTAGKLETAFFNATAARAKTPAG